LRTTPRTSSFSIGRSRNRISIRAGSPAERRRSPGFHPQAGSLCGCAIPNLILLDLNLSKYTGEDILREIRSAGHLAGVPVCVWSSSRSRRDAALLKDLGVSQFIPKPSGLDQFMEIGKIIKDLLADGKGG
jgi:CheY-like chemotaxis protein